MKLLSAALLTLTLLPAAAFAGPPWPRFDQPAMSPASPAATDPIASDPITVRLVVPVACAPFPTLDVQRSGGIIELRFRDAEFDCPTPPHDESFSFSIGSLPVGSYSLRLMDASNPAGGEPIVDFTTITVVPGGPCFGLCMHGGRFTATAQWHTSSQSGDAHPVALTSQSGALWFFDAENPEVMVKVLDACSYNGHFWMFLTGLTNVGVDLTVSDAVTGQTRTYTNAVGHAFAPVADTDTFSCFPVTPP